MIEVCNLHKSFAERTALNGINLSIPEGEFYGLLGPNGAGKTTAISIMSTLIKSDSGSVRINDIDTAKNPARIKELIGVVPQEIALYDELTAFENLMFWGSLYRVPHKQLSNRANELLNLFALSDRKNDKLKNYSGGMKRRINIASALLHRPKILFMDEPTVGIDPQSRNMIFDVTENLHQQGMTIVYTTHYMEEAEQHCNRIGIIDNGQIIAEGSLDELKKSTSTKETIAITVTSTPINILGEMAEFWPDMKQTENTLNFNSSDIKTDISRLVLKCHQLQMENLNIEIVKTNLESLFLNLTGRHLRD